MLVSGLLPSISIMHKPLKKQIPLIKVMANIQTTGNQHSRGTKQDPRRLCQFLQSRWVKAVHELYVLSIDSYIQPVSEVLALFVKICQRGSENGSLWLGRHPSVSAVRTIITMFKTFRTSEGPESIHNCKLPRMHSQMDG